MVPRKSMPGPRRWETMNRPKGQFVWFERVLLESPAWAAMPLAARRVVERVAIEHMSHGGTQNGELPVTYDDFARFGVRRQSISAGIKAAGALGFLDVTARGMLGHGVAKRPSTYGLTWLPRCDGTPPSNRWKAIRSMKEAKAIVRGARCPSE